MADPKLEKSIEDRFRKLTDIEHVLHRPGMYVGSTNSREEDVYLLTEGKLKKSRVLWNPAFMKIFDEIISNAVDEHRRNPKLNEIRVSVSQTESRITIRDNGGIPVVMHQTHNEWVPEMIFSNLKAGSNFNDEEQRLVAGTNGVGSTLTNIFSLEFTVRTSDGKNRFEQTFRKNMTERTEAEVLKTRGSGYTEISFIPDLARFGMEVIDEEHVKIMQKRCLDLAACNPALRIFFNDEEHKFSSFREYCALYADAAVYEEAPRWKIGVAPSDGSFTQVSFVNSVETRDGGTHVDYVSQQIVSYIRERVRKKHKIELKPGELRNHFFLFVQADVVNPGFSSQTKEKLITESKDFGSKYEVSEKTLKEIFASEVIQRILDWAQQKALAEERKQLRELNKNISKEKVLKLIDAKAREGRSRCTLALFEGDCLHEDTETLVFREDEGPLHLPLREVRVGDYVVSHRNTLRMVTAKSEKISRLFKIRTAKGDYFASGAHRFQVYDVLEDSFDFVRVDALKPGRHRLVANKLSYTLEFSHITRVNPGKTADSLILETSKGFLDSVSTHKFAVLDLEDQTFKLMAAESLEAGRHVLALSMVKESTIDR